MRIYDNTKISTFRACPRKYYFRHVRHWTGDKPTPELAFGSAWHAAMEVVWPMLVDKAPQGDIIQASYAAFLDKWVSEGMPEPRDINFELEKELAPRTPGNALEMLVGYIETRAHQLAKGDFEIISVERPFIVPLDPTDDSLFYVGKIDKVVSVRGRYTAIEHKTTTLSQKKQNGSYTFRWQFIDSFSPNSQVDGYLYALHMSYPGKAGGVWVDAALVHKTDQAFLFIPVERQLPQLDMWLWETRYWIDQIEANVAHLEHVKPEDRYMAAFPKETNSCFDYNRACAYMVPCKSWANPQHKPVPAGFKESEWNPLEHIKVGELIKEK